MRWQDMTSEKEKYAAYLCSREWAEKREAVRERSLGKCERCFISPMEACHHLTYERKYEERLEDLQAICNRCHEFTHGKNDFDPRDYILLPNLDDSGGNLLCPRCDLPNVIAYCVQLVRPTEIQSAVLLSLMCDCGLKFKMVINQGGVDEKSVVSFQLRKFSKGE